MTAPPSPVAAASARTSSTSCGCGVLNEICVPPLKSIPRLRPCQTREPKPTKRTAPEMANHTFALPTKSIFCQAGILCALAPMKAGLLNQRKPASTPRRARVAATAVTIERSVPIRSIRAKPRTPPVAAMKRTAAVIIVTTFASTIVLNPLR
jgi:hypothetical protein